MPSNGLQRATLHNPEARTRITGGLAPTIQAEGLQHYYGHGELKKQVLFNNTLAVYPGEIIIMTGPSGSGKTTLLTLIGTLRRVQEGKLAVLGHQLHEAKDADLIRLRKEIGFIFQAHNLFDSLSATQNVRMALELTQPEQSMREKTKIAQRMLALVGLEERLGHKPKQLSGGQKQRVAIARGLVHKPKLVLADEPTAALDEQSGRTVVELFQKLAKEQQTTIVIVTHDNRILDVADRIINLVDGEIRSDVLIQEASIISEMLAQCRIFDRVTPRTLASVADQMIAMTVPPGTVVIREGDLGDRFYLVRKGRVIIQRGQDQKVIAELQAGDFFGETALLTGQPRNATVTTTEETILYALSDSDFKRAMSDSATFDEEIRRTVFDR
ncbi:MAG: ATP-binding cassette domain-containing protein [Pirellulaceae bacterium]|nr:ATP-binding cassette domain-containing protein [Pirellulaceae bacterium]